MKKPFFTIILCALLLDCVAARRKSPHFHFFYLVQQWPGSYCDTSKGCCYPTTGKPAADFGIHGLWPNYDNGSYPSKCDHSNPFDPSQIANLKSSMQTNWPTLACPSGDGTQFWSHEWSKHGTCSESVLDQRSYFKAALSLRKKTNLLQALESAGVTPDGNSYSLGSIEVAINKSTGHTPFIQCNRDKSGNSQLYQVYICVHTSGSRLIDCPVFPMRKRKCSTPIKFPSF